MDIDTTTHNQPYPVYCKSWIEKAIGVTYKLGKQAMYLLAAFKLSDLVGDFSAILILVVFFTVEAMSSEIIYSHSNMGIGNNRTETLLENIAYGIREAAALMIGVILAHSIQAAFGK